MLNESYSPASLHRWNRVTPAPCWLVILVWGRLGKRGYGSIEVQNNKGFFCTALFAHHVVEPIAATVHAGCPYATVRDRLRL